MDKRRMRNLNFEKLITKTGVPLYVMPLPHANTVAAGVFVRAGSRDEILPHEAGLAHALEHMHLQGTTSFPSSKELHGFIEEFGGYTNAWTSMEGTFYHGQVPAEHGNNLIMFLSEILNRSTFPKEKIPIEMKNIVEEIKMYYDNPQTFLGEQAYLFFYKNHPLGKFPLGTKEAVSAFEQRHFFDFKARYYAPQNYAFVLAGNIEPQAALSLFEEHFPEPYTGASNNRENAAFAQEKTSLVERRRDIEQVNIMLLAPLPGAKTKETTALDMFATMVSGGASFPLFQEIRDKRGLCYDVQADTDKYADVSNFNIYIGTDAMRYAEALDTSIQVVQNSVSDDLLLTKARKLRKGRIALLFENPGRIIDFAAHDLLTYDAPRGYTEIVAEIESVSIHDVSAAVAAYLKPEQFRRVLLVPESLEMKS